MKRSEFHKKLYRKLYDLYLVDHYRPSKQNSEPIDKLIDFLMDDIGLLPPLNTNNYHFMDNDARKDVKTCEFYFQWDDEDE